VVAKRVRIVRHHHHGLAEILVQFGKDGQDVVGRCGVQVAGRLVGQDQRRVGDNGARNRHALLLSTGELPGIVAQAVAQTDQLQRCGRVVQPLLLLQVGELERQLHVLKRRQHRNQIELLKDEAHVLVAPVGDLAVVELSQVVAQHAYLAAGSLIHRRDQVQQRGFAGPGRTHQRHKLALSDLNIDVLQGDHVELVTNEFLAQAARFDECLVHIYSIMDFKLFGVPGRHPSA
jgi:hypothetical protein